MLLSRPVTLAAIPLVEEFLPASKTAAQGARLIDGSTDTGPHDFPHEKKKRERERDRPNSGIVGM